MGGTPDTNWLSEVFCVLKKVLVQLMKNGNKNRNKNKNFAFLSVIDHFEESGFVQTQSINKCKSINCCVLLQDPGCDFGAEGPSVS